MRSYRPSRFFHRVAAGLVSLALTAGLIALVASPGSDTYARVKPSETTEPVRHAKPAPKVVELPRVVIYGKRSAVSPKHTAGRAVSQSPA